MFDQDNYMTQESRVQFKKIEDRTYIVGNGTPEGMVSAPIASTYKDLDGTTGSITYFKKLANVGGDESKGWVLE